MKTTYRWSPLTLVACALALLALPQFAGPTPNVALAAPTPQALTISLEEIADVNTVDGSQPVAIANAGDGSDRLFIVEQPGRIMIYSDTQLLATPFLDITSIVKSDGSEQGLLGLAFDPDFAENGYFYVNYTNENDIGDTAIVRYQVSAGNPNVANPGSATPLLTITQPQANHNGGALQFGPDDFLYIATGDGGNGGDTGEGHNPAIGNAQDLNSLLGKMLRIDVRNNNTADGLPYDIPPGNPFANDGNPNTRAEIWAYGLRNPWRFSFDRQTGDMFIGDVGQGSVEEVDFQPAASTGGLNYGWRRMEGSDCFNPSTGCDTGALIKPILEYDKPQPCGAVTGGYRYRGARYPSLAGVYFYADYCIGQIWAATQSGATWTPTNLLDISASISTFGEDENGELYLADRGSGSIYHIVAPSFFVHMPLVKR
jgi:glucose/arabinose dehydrogenase